MFRAATIAVIAVFSLCGPVKAQSPQGESVPAGRSVGFLIDNSGTFRRVLDRAIRIAAGVAEGLPDGSAGFLITYTDQENIFLKQDLTNDREMLADEIENIFVRPGRTAVWDAIGVAADHFRKDTPIDGRRTLIVFTDGDELGSVSKPDQVIKDLQELKVSVVAVGLAERQVNQKMIDRLVRETGGSKIVPQSGGEAKTVAAEILARLNDGN
ncbi:MAG: VWA domain-containing protein [Acidobacteria bacterium]|nr:VWA domain-containing protein [Acidobacteriota bacterium]